MKAITQSELQRREAVDRERQRLRDIEILRRRFSYLRETLDSQGDYLGRSYDLAEAGSLKRAIIELER